MQWCWNGSRLEMWTRCRGPPAIEREEAYHGPNHARCSSGRFNKTKTLTS
jgi:hypothetical protein